MKKICPNPFSSMALGADYKNFVPCCADWLTDEFKSLDVGVDPWNGPAAQELRKSMFDQSFRYCKTTYCQTKLVDLSREPKSIPFSPITKNNWQSLFAEDTKMPDGPTFLNVIADDRCNLACPSCRKEKITRLNADQEQQLVKTQDLIHKYSSTLQILKITNGEVFFSPWLRNLIQSLNAKEFPSLRYVYVISNGLLFNQRTYEQLRPGIQYLKSISISMDAGNRETYEKVRGGDWAQLQENLLFIARLRREKSIGYFQINFTVQKQNYKSIPELVKLAQDLEVDNVKFIALFSWDRMAINYSDHAVHLKTHPEHQQLRLVYEQIADEKKVWWALPIPDAGAYQQPVQLHE